MDGNRRLHRVAKQAAQQRLVPKTDSNMFNRLAVKARKVMEGRSQLPGFTGARAIARLVPYAAPTKKAIATQKQRPCFAPSAQIRKLPSFTCEPCWTLLLVLEV
jgi:hypothetical protein